ncbi:hypothetical protein CRH09_27120 [Nocardia terpenica]|uniref:Uncharacterized protein n=1 Tax=Nocardia terpenica TaxID=455432 RepID=A0A291RPQ5_9NOCA|nr:hypothetical protein CRH09_27120 [Nocardia terpenica]
MNWSQSPTPVRMHGVAFAAPVFILQAVLDGMSFPVTDTRVRASRALVTSVFVLRRLFCGPCGSMSWSRFLTPVRMQRVALVAPAFVLRIVLGRWR